MNSLAAMACRLLLIGPALFAAATNTFAQAPAKQAAFSLQSVSPAGCQRGAGLEIALSGAGLKEATSLFLFEPTISARRVADDRWRIEAAESAAPRDRDLWVVGPTGVAGPLRFSVSQTPQIVEQEPNNSAAEAQRIEVPAIVHGRIEPGVDRDWFRIAAEAGEHLVIACRTYSLDTLVEPALTVVDPHGREIRHDAGGARDGFVHFTAEAAGEYLVQVQERAYRKTKANGYALVVHNGPWLVAAFPFVLKAGESRNVTLYGYGLPDGSNAEGAGDRELMQLVVPILAPTSGDADGGGWTPASAAPVDGFEYRHPDAGGSVRFQLTDSEIVEETAAANDLLDQVQAITLPAEIAGRFLTPGDVDWFRFSASKDQTLWIEAVGQRAGETIDLDIGIHDAKGKLLESLTDQPQPKGSPTSLPLATTDPAGAWKVPADGEYCLAIRDLYGSVAEGVERGYRLSIGPRREAATVAVTAAGVLVKPGGAASIPLIAVRRGGHQAPIRVWAENLPAGLSAAELTLPGDKLAGELKLRAAADAASFVGGLQLAAETQLDGQMVRVPVRVVAHIHDGTAQRVRFTGHSFDESGVDIQTVEEFA